MGRTPRVSNSPYATANRNIRRRQRISGNGARVDQSESDSRDNRADSPRLIRNRTRSRVVPQRSCEEDTNRNQSTPSSTMPNNNTQLAQTVADIIMPELQGHITQAVRTLGRSPQITATPDTAQQRDHNTGTGITLNSQNSVVSQNNGSGVPLSDSFRDDLGLHVAQSVKDKIINGEYIELESLILNNINAVDQSKALVVDNSGNINVKQTNKRTITDISTWIDAFLIFASIYIRAHPEAMQGILKYMANVKLGAHRCIGLGWLSYDQQFRLRKAKNIAMEWGTVDMELWLLYISQGHKTMPQIENNTTYFGKCFKYNNTGICGRSSCRFSHKCLKCGGAHAAIFCNIQKHNQNALGGKPQYTPAFPQSVHMPGKKGDRYENREVNENAPFRFRHGNRKAEPGYNHTRSQFSSFRQNPY